MAARPDLSRPFPFFLYQRRNTTTPPPLHPNYLHPLFPSSLNNNTTNPRLSHLSDPPPLSSRQSSQKPPKRSQNSPKTLHLQKYTLTSRTPISSSSEAHEKDHKHPQRPKKQADNWPSGFPLEAHCKDHRMSYLWKSTGSEARLWERQARAAAPFLTPPSRQATLP